MERCEVVFRGRVQGVGFRATVSSIATHYPITGYVTNLRDGGVRLVAEGERRSVSAAIQKVKEAMHGYIHEQVESWSTATGEFEEFAVRHEGR